MPFESPTTISSLWQPRKGPRKRRIAGCLVLASLALCIMEFSLLLLWNTIEHDTGDVAFAPDNVSPQKKVFVVDSSMHDDFPPTITICNVTDLSFNKSKMIMRRINSAFIPGNDSRNVTYAYGPYVTKSGSSSITAALTYLYGGRKFKFRNTRWGKKRGMGNMQEESLDQYHFVSILRHPMERALAGFFEIERFWAMNWMSGIIDQKGLTWWNHTCLNSTWGQVNLTHPCRGSDPKTEPLRKIERLNDFLDEIEHKGFWNQHFTPMTYIISSSRIGQRASYYDLEQMNNLTAAIIRSAGQPSKSFHNMRRSDRPADSGGLVIKWDQLVKLSSNFKVASAAINKLCNLYRVDVDCLPYDVPECSNIYKQKKRL